MIGTSKVQECSDGVGGDGWGRGGIMQSWGEWITAVAACFRVLEGTVEVSTRSQGEKSERHRSEDGKRGETARVVVNDSDRVLTWW